MPIDQLAYRARNDDGSEAGASWKEAANTPWRQALDANFRVRFLARSSAVAPGAGTLNYRVFYSKNGGAWTQADNLSSVVRASASPNVADGTTTTQQLGSGAFSSGEVDTGNSRVTFFRDAANTPDEESEGEFCVQARSADLANNDVVELRLHQDLGAAIDGYTQTARFTAQTDFTPPAAPTGLTANAVAAGE